MHCRLIEPGAGCYCPFQVLASRSGAADKLDLDFVWHLQTPLNCLPEDAAVFMELRHYKADKKKVCTAWPSSCGKT